MKKKITTGLAMAGLAALTLGTASPVAAEPGSGAPVANETTAAASPSSTSTSATAAAAPRIASIEPSDRDELSVMGMAPGARVVGIRVEGGPSEGAGVVDGRFAALIDIAHLGKNATLISYTPQGVVEVDFVLEPQYAEGENEAPGTPVIHAVSQYDDDSFVIEGTVAHQPDLFSKTEVWANRSGMSWDFPSENGSFSLTVPASRAGEIIDVTAYYRGHASETAQVELVETERNTASEVHPLEVESPTAGDVLAAPEATFTGSGIPNSQIVVSRDEKTNRASSTLCETRVTSLGDWSCTSPALPAGSYDTVVTETPTWTTAPKQTAGTAFSVADTTPDPGASNTGGPATPILSSVTEEADGSLIVRAIVNGAGQARIEVGDHSETLPRGQHGRFPFTLDGSMLGQTATITGVSPEGDGDSIEIDLTPTEAPAGSPLAAPQAHGVTKSEGEPFYVQGTTSYFDDEYSVPSVIAQVDGEFIGATGATWNGAFFIAIPAEYAGQDIDLITVRNAELSEATTITVEPTEGNTASEAFPLEVTSPAEGESVTPDLTSLVGEGIPGARISIESSATEGDAPLITSVLGDGSWSVPVTAPLLAGDHEMTVTETPYWPGVASVTSARSFTVSDGSDGSEDGDDSEGGESDERAITVTTPVDGSTFAAGSVVTYTGTATPEATVSVRLGYGLAPLVAEADENGNWTVSRWLGNAPYTATITQSKDGKQIGERHTGPTITPAATTAPIVVTAPTDGGTFAAGSVVTYTGTATAEATVSVRLGYGLAPLVADADENGDWTVSRWLGNAPYTATITQSKDGKQIGGSHTGPTITPAATTAPVVVTAPVDGSTFAAGSAVTFTGTATPGADIAVHLGYGLAPVTGTANASGDWSVSRWLGNAPYTAKVIQSKNGTPLTATHTGPTITPAR
ncbi:hypothetical protein SOM11_11575 [Frigoribacterium sp. CFBP9039]|uniref:hypothetical protein n=3 Tax=Frigoribacterium TaxID=96492 RepID=UPI002A699A1F|nr:MULTISPECIES: hypothetical protein [unclassified Frigoribacterium]MDY0891978.1 hypothetical protein [Frigoribacterium sp. CFBP9030]MDY0946625.1 hypothetical protein [Frigoribacterium sp. CFBP9039]